MNINGRKYVVKKYIDELPTIGGKFYLQSDYGIQIDAKSEQLWINNGIYQHKIHSIIIIEWWKQLIIMIHL